MAVQTLIYELDLIHGTALPGAADHTASDVIELREGAAVTTVNMRTALNEITGFNVSSWDEINPAVSTATFTKQFTTNSGGTWATLTGTAVSDVINTDITITETNAESAGTFTISLAAGSITTNKLHDATAAFRVMVELDDGE